MSTISSAAKEAKSSERSRRKHYSEEFRQEALRILEKGRTATQLARELGLSTWSLCQWKKRYGVGKAAEVASLRVELHSVTRQREVLKKALAILGQESPIAML